MYIKLINMHEQKNITIEVDRKIQPLIQFINDVLPGLIPIASCQGGINDDESDDAYILLIVRSMKDLDYLMNICSVYNCIYNSPDTSLGNIPTYRLGIPDLDLSLENLKMVDSKYF